MSASAFKQLFENQAFKEWYHNPGKTQDSLTIFQAGRAEFKSFIQNSVGDFVISEQQLENMLGKTKALKILGQAKLNPEVEVRNVSGQTQLFIPQLKFSTLNNDVTRILDHIGSEAGLSNVGGQIGYYLDNNSVDIGHVFGFSNSLVNRVKESAGKKVLSAAENNLSSARGIGDTSGISKAELDLANAKKQIAALEEVIDRFSDVLEDYDMATSDIKGLDLAVYAKYRKTSSNWLFEWQGSVANQASGNTVSGLLGKIKQSKAFGSGFRGIFATALISPKHLSKVLTSFVEKYSNLSTNSASNLSILEQKGSPSIKELIGDELVSILAGSPRKYAREYLGATKLNKIPLSRLGNKKTDTSKARAEVKLAKTKITSVKNKLSKTVLRTLTGQFFSLASLQALLDRHLQDVISANMGSGSDRRVLNYRTGRLASSAKVERLTGTRDGMITAFYSYMRNPYGTFSDGGRQQYPKSRDPKLLIAGAIREIAATQVGNRMRAVLV